MVEIRLPELIWLCPRLISSGNFFLLFCYIFFFGLCMFPYIFQHWSVRVISLITNQHCHLLVEHDKFYRPIICMLRPRFHFASHTAFDAADFWTCQYTVSMIIPRGKSRSIIAVLMLSFSEWQKTYFKELNRIFQFHGHRYVHTCWEENTICVAGQLEHVLSEGHYKCTWLTLPADSHQCVYLSLCVCVGGVSVLVLFITLSCGLSGKSVPPLVRRSAVWSPSLFVF